MVWRLPGCSATMAGVADVLRQTLRGLAMSQKNEPTSILKALGYSLGASALIWLNSAAHRRSGKRPSTNRQLLFAEMLWQARCPPISVYALPVPINLIFTS